MAQRQRVPSHSKWFPPQALRNKRELADTGHTGQAEPVDSIQLSPQPVGNAIVPAANLQKLG